MAQNHLLWNYCFIFMVGVATLVSGSLNLSNVVINIHNHHANGSQQPVAPAAPVQPLPVAPPPEAPTQPLPVAPSPQVPAQPLPVVPPPQVPVQSLPVPSVPLVPQTIQEVPKVVNSSSNATLPVVPHPLPTLATLSELPVFPEQPKAGVPVPVLYVPTVQQNQSSAVAPNQTRPLVQHRVLTPPATKLFQKSNSSNHYRKRHRHVPNYFLSKAEPKRQAKQQDSKDSKIQLIYVIHHFVPPNLSDLLSTSSSNTYDIATLQDAKTKNPNLPQLLKVISSSSNKNRYVPLLPRPGSTVVHDPTIRVINPKISSKKIRKKVAKKEKAEEETHHQENVPEGVLEKLPEVKKVEEVHVCCEEGQNPPGESEDPFLEIA